MKRIVTMIIIFSMIVPSCVRAENAEVSSYEPEIQSKHCICIERTTEQVLFEKDAYTKCAMASTTKILTGIVIIENCDLQEEVIISKKAANIGGSTLGIQEGQKITVENLLYGLLLRSGNDTAIALAEHLSGTVEEFCQKMNDTAKTIGLKNSNFESPHGLDSEDHYTTAYDMAILTNYALNNEVFQKIVSTKQITIYINGYHRILINTNELLGNVEGVYGVKTGFTGNAGRCLITACKRNDLDIIVVILGADTKNIRGNDTKKVIKYVFENFKMVDLRNEIEELFYDFKNTEKIQILKALNKMEFNYSKKENYICPIDKNKIGLLKTSLYYISQIEAPIYDKTIVGKIRILCEDKILFESDIFVCKKIDRVKPLDYFAIFVKKYITFYMI